MSRRFTISLLWSLTVALVVASPEMLAQSETLTLQAGRRVAVQPLTRLDELAVALETTPYDSAEAEPNDRVESAMKIAVPARVQGTIASADPATIPVDYSDGVAAGLADVFVFRIDASHAITADVTWSDPETDLDLFLFEKIGGVLHVIDASARADAAAETLQTPVLQPGTYYVGIAAFRGATEYHLSVSGQASSATCSEDTTTMCLNNGRFRVRATWSTSTGSGNAGAVPLTSDTGLLWFFNNGNVELIVKVLDACPVNNRFWVFAGGLTDVNLTMTVTDTVTGASKQYTNSGGRAFAPVTDTDAFASCGSASCSYSITPASRSFEAGGGSGAFTVSSSSGCSWTATSNASWITVTSGAGGSGNGTVSYSVAANGTNNARSGTISAGGQTHTVTQNGSAPTGYDGTWSGATSQPGKTISFVVSNSLITSVTITYTATGSCTVDGSTTTTYNPGRPITGSTFTLTGSGPTGFTINGVFASSNSATGTVNVIISQPFPPCSASASGTWAASR